MSETRAGRLLTVHEIASLLGVSRPQVYALLKLTDLPHLRLHDRGDLRFDEDDVRAWIQSRKVAS
jgi:excisionase family DNA binding protein